MKKFIKTYFGQIIVLTFLFITSFATGSTFIYCVSSFCLGMTVLTMAVHFKHVKGKKNLNIINKEDIEF